MRYSLFFRKRRNIDATDFLARLADLMREKAANPDSESLKFLNDDIIVAQSAIFFLAGQETTANTLSTTCYNLAKNPDVQVICCNIRTYTIRVVSSVILN